MSPEEDQPSADEQEVSRLLAEAAGPEPLPAEVADRLDTVLADLVRERATDSADTSAGSRAVVPLARRRRWPQVLLAAAAVVAVGYGATVVTQQATDDASQAESATDAGGAAQGDLAPELAEEGVDRAASIPVHLRSERLESDVLRVLETRGVLSGSAALDTRSDAQELTKQELRAACSPPPLDRRERWVPSRYDGRRSVLVTEPERDGFVDATVYTCDGARLAAVSVPAP